MSVFQNSHILDFGNWREEISSLANKPVMSPLTDFSLLKVSGVDAVKFLQGQLTCDITQLDTKKMMLGAHCNAKGRVLSLFYVFKKDDSIYFILPQEIAESTLAGLKKYAIFSKVTLAIDTDWGALGVKGECPSSHGLLTLTHPLIETTSFLISDYSSLEKTWRALQNQFKPVGAIAWKHLEMAAGIPRLSEKNLGLFTPHDLNLPKLGAVSFSKGCYTGQEIVARMEYKGKLKQGLQQLHSDKPLSPGDLLYNAEQQPTGTVVNVIPDLEGYQLLAVARQDL